jgi:hypothetical protein
MNPHVTCACGAEAAPTYEEVDIGVGVQRFLVGWECPEHGGICGVCSQCAVPDRPGYVHETWCRERPGETITAEAFEAETAQIAEKFVERFKVAPARLDPDGTATGKTVLTAPVVEGGCREGTMSAGPVSCHVDTETGVRTPLGSASPPTSALVEDVDAAVRREAKLQGGDH